MVAMPNFIKSFARSMAVGRVIYYAVDQKYEPSFDAIDPATTAISVPLLCARC